MSLLRIGAVRAVLDEWNEDHSPNEQPWEWVEEMVLAKHRWQSLARQRKATALDHYSRYQEFLRKLPRPLVDKILEVCKQGG